MGKMVMVPETVTVRNSASSLTSVERRGKVGATYTSSVL